eukprot:5359428-Ditylum_brightwellii.AAC.1
MGPNEIRSTCIATSLSGTSRRISNGLSLILDVTLRAAEAAAFSSVPALSAIVDDKWESWLGRIPLQVP